MNIHNDWYEEAKNMTLDELPKFINKLLNDYKHDYGTICHAFTASAIATLNAMNKHEQGGITGFQASCIMWEFIKHWIYSDNKIGLKIIDYDKFLYPQYEKNFDKVLDKRTWQLIQEEAKRNLESSNFAHPNVIRHWQSIANGKVPFGYRVE